MSDRDEKYQIHSAIRGEMKEKIDILRDIFIFIEACRINNFTRTSQCLGIPLATIARRISILEEKIGVRLIERTTRRQKLTDEGRRLFETSEHLVDEILTVFDQTKSAYSSLEGSIRVDIPRNVVNTKIINTFLAFINANPGVSILIKSSDQLAPSDDVDFTICVGEPSAPTLIKKKISEVRFEFYSRPSEIDGKLLDIDCELASGRHLFVSESQLAYLNAVSDPSLSRKVNFNGRFLCATSDIAEKIAIEGLGISLLSSDCAVRHAKKGDLVKVSSKTKPITIPMYLVTCKKNNPTRVRQLMDALTREFRETPYLAQITAGAAD